MLHVLTGNQKSSVDDGMALSGDGFFDHVSFEWKEDRVYMKRWVNMNSQALERPVVTAKICES